MHTPTGKVSGYVCLMIVQIIFLALFLAFRALRKVCSSRAPRLCHSPRRRISKRTRFKISAVPGHSGYDIHWLWLPDDLPAQIWLQRHRLYSVHVRFGGTVVHPHEGIPAHGSWQDQHTPIHTPTYTPTHTHTPLHTHNGTKEKEESATLIG
ncbi:GH15702 [Drosophila grimshawi]|uniref:GH15702 n=1 Tax=Drosophila grimshawi TaxID=7222 RepID=B4IZ56_DROGR|nr:GH15702 [Drosophila grimshawi]